MAERKYALDVKAFKRETFLLSFEDKSGHEQKLHVKKPTEEIMIEFLKFSSLEDVSETEATKELLRDIKPFVKIAISNNEEGITVDDAFFDKYGIDFDLTMTIFRVYSSYVSDTMSDPNSSAPESQGQTKEAATTN